VSENSVLGRKCGSNREKLQEAVMCVARTGYRNASKFWKQNLKVGDLKVDRIM
jgi:hypothetical protein